MNKGNKYYCDKCHELVYTLEIDKQLCTKNMNVEICKTITKKPFFDRGKKGLFCKECLGKGV